MDRSTLDAYDHDAAVFAKDWHEQPAPVDLQEIVARFFIKGGATADIGCGSGREVAWLNANGYATKGFDASDGLLAEARSRYPAPGRRIGEGPGTFLERTPGLLRARAHEGAFALPLCLHRAALSSPACREHEGGRAELSSLQLRALRRAGANLQRL